jgi:pyruvate dehydrogenase E1 component
MPEMPEQPGIREGILKGLYRYRKSEKKNAKMSAQLLGSGAIMFEVLKAQEILEKDYGIAVDVWSVTSYKELYRDANDCARWNMLHPTKPAKVPYVTQTLKDASGPFVAASDYMKVLPESLAQWIPGKLVALGTDGFGRSENRESLRDFFEVDAKHIVLATLYALAGEKKAGSDGVNPKLLEKAIQDLGIDSEKLNPAIS